MPATTKQVRDVTLALQLVQKINQLRRARRSPGDALKALTAVLTRMDARTGRRDPSARKKTTPKKKPVATKARRA